MFKFTIRDLLWLTVIVALGAAWWVDRRHVIAEREEIREVFQRFADEQYEHNYRIGKLLEAHVSTPNSSASD